MGSFIKNAFIILSLVAIAAIGYYLIVAERGAVITANDALSVGQAERETQEFLLHLGELQTIELSTALFSDPRFDSLVDFTEPVEPVPFGRPNPFAE